MAKKTVKSPESPDGTAAAPPVKRRAPAPKKRSEAAAAPIDVATVGRTEPLVNASDRGANTKTPNGYQPSHEEIAQAAYFRHLKRGASGGDEVDDWVEAERELRERKR